MNVHDTKDGADYVARTSTIRIATERDDGSEVVTPIWGVVVDGIPYIRNGYGERSKWYRRVQRTSRIALVDGARRYPGTIEHVADEEMIRRVDAAYKAKYAGQGIALEQAVSSDVRSYTLRVNLEQAQAEHTVSEHAFEGSTASRRSSSCHTSGRALRGAHWLHWRASCRSLKRQLKGPP